MNLNYLERLGRARNLLCLGLDPVPGRLPPGYSPDVEGAGRFLEDLLEAAHEHALLPSTLKPNLAYFEQFGWRGWKLLHDLVERWRPHCLIILDAKRGDIGRSSEAYAQAMFDTLKGDSVTLHPWMGPDSIEPFSGYFPRHGGYLLLRTSNPGGDVLQETAWQALFSSVDHWDATGSLGFVVGATRPAELEWVMANNFQGRPLLIPGVGSQGGSAQETLAILKTGVVPARHRVNVSSSILYAHEHGQFPGSNLRELEQMTQALSL